MPLLRMDELEILKEHSIELLLSCNLPTTASLIRVSSIEFVSDAECPTAQMIFNPRTGIAKIELGQEFVSQHAYKPLRLATLLLHELFHHLLHHYVLYPSDRMTNISQDVLINALICRLAPSFQQLFNDVYTKNEFPQMMLRPGATLRRIKNVEIAVKVSSLYHQLYRKPVAGYWANRFASNPQEDGATVSFEDIHKTLEEIKAIQENIQKANLAAGNDEMDGLEGLEKSWWGEDSLTKLLGHHPASDVEQPDPFDTTELDDEHQDFGNILDNLTKDISSNGNAAGLFIKGFKINAEKAPDELLEAMARGLRDDVMRCKQIVEGVIGPRPALQTVIPLHLGRKQILQLSNGYLPVFYPSFGPDEKPEKDVIIYVDVSGSMGSQAAFILMLLTAFKQQIGTEFYQFSTEIAPIDYAQFVENFEKTGEVFLQTTGGTDFNPIFEHAQAKGFSKVVLITDGCAGLSGDAEQFARDIETFTVFTEHHNADPLTDVSQETWIMPSISSPLS